MRKSRQESTETRQHIVEAASAEFRAKGIDGTSLADLMAAAGLTHGGFYKHFASKEQVVEESLALAADSMVESWKRTFAASSEKHGLDTAIAEYLSKEHRDDLAAGCPFAALGSEVAHGSDACPRGNNIGLSENDRYRSRSTRRLLGSSSEEGKLYGFCPRWLGL